MPEGNVIHNQARRLSRAFKGKDVFVDSPQGRFDAGARQVSGHRLTSVQAFGKHLYIGFDNQLWVHVHLGLFGKWQIGRGQAPEPRGLIRVRIQSADHYAELRGPTVCEVLTDGQMHQSITRIGPDPIRADADPSRAWERIRKSSSAIGSLLMDQRVFAGVGNIYRAEVLFRHNISPFRPGSKITRAQFDAIWADLVVLMTHGSKTGRIDTVREEHGPDAMGRAARVDRHGGEVYVYRRADMPCLMCGTVIRLADMQGRNLYWCPRCQRR